MPRQPPPKVRLRAARVPAPARAPARPSVGQPAPIVPLSDAELAELQTLLDGVPPTHEAMDASMLDGFLCGVLLQPSRIAPARWLPWIADADAGRPLPPRWPLARLHALAKRRHAELDDAIERRAWFDPWVYAEPADGATDVSAVYPWVAGFAAAMAAFPALMDDPSPALNEALALLLRHLDPDDLEDADDLQDAIADLAELDGLDAAVEDLVRATLRMADVTRPPVRPPARR